MDYLVRNDACTAVMKLPPFTGATDIAADLLAKLVEVPADLCNTPLHVPIVPAEYSLDMPTHQPASGGIHPDHFCLGDLLLQPDLLEGVSGHLLSAGRPPVALLGLAVALSRTIPMNMRFVVIRQNTEDVLASLLSERNSTRPMTNVVLAEPEHAVVVPAPSCNLHQTIVAAPCFTFAETRPERVGLVYLANIKLSDPHWNWFHPERLIETIDACLLAGGYVIIAGSGRQNIRIAIVDVFLRLHKGHYDVVYGGRFGVSAAQADQTLILRKRRDFDAGTIAAMRDASSRLFGEIASLSHEMDPRLVTRSATALAIQSGHELMTSHVIVPSRMVTIHSLQDDRYKTRFPDYFERTYRTPDIRLNRLTDGIVCSRLPTFIASRDGTLFLASYALHEYLDRAGISHTEQLRIAARRAHGDSYLDQFSLDSSIMWDGLPALTNYIEEPVFYFGIRWMNMYGHFLHEACPQITLWKQYLRPRGVKLLVHSLASGFQSDALRSLGVTDEDMIPFPATATLMCRQLWFSNSFEDARYNVLPETSDFADQTSLSDKSRHRHLKVYAARTDTKNRRLVNEAELIERLEQEGFLIFLGSQHSLAEQIAIFEQADIIVGKDGTNLTNIIFGNSDTLLVEILGEEFFDPLYLRIANTRGLQYDHVVARTAFGSGRDAESIVDVDEVVDTVGRALRRREKRRAFGNDTVGTHH